MGLYEDMLARVTPGTFPSVAAPPIDPEAEQKAVQDAAEAAALRMRRAYRPGAPALPEGSLLPFGTLGAGMLSPDISTPDQSAAPAFDGSTVPQPRDRPKEADGTPVDNGPVTDLSGASVANPNRLPQPDTVGPPVPVASPAAPAAAPVAPAEAPTSFGSLASGLMSGLKNNSATLLALGAGFAGAPNIGQGISRAAAAAIPASQADLKNRMTLESQQQTLKALIAKGIPAQDALAAISNPDVMKATVAKYFETKPPTVHDITGPLGDKVPVVFDAAANQGRGEFRDMSGKPLAGASGDIAGAGGTGSTQVLAPGVKFDATKTGQERFDQYSEDVKAAAKAYMNGDVMPSGNPRQNGIANFAKTVAQRYGQDTGVPVSDALYNQKRQLQTDLAKGSANTVGGILKNGLSAFSHLGNLSEKFTELGNYSGPNVPGGAHIGTVGNVVANELLPTPKKAGQLEAVRDNALKYGQEATKFYAGSGGGADERMMALRGVGSGRANAEEQAAFLETEKQLMTERLNAQQNSVRSILGQGYIDSHPDIFNPKEFQTSVAKIDANIARLRGHGAAPASAVPPAPGNYTYDPVAKKLVPAQ